MPKWKSPLFSDIRNAIGDNVVFSMWKGRPFFRSYVIPANPRTEEQVACRADMRELVKRYQGLKADPAVKTAWNESALPLLISGYNLFAKWGRMSWIYATPTSGTEPLDITLTYKCGVPLSRAAIYQLFDGTWTEVDIDGGILASGEVELEDLPDGEYEFFIADKETVVEDDEGPQNYQAITKWYPDLDPESPTYGELHECKVVVAAT